MESPLPQEARRQRQLAVAALAGFAVLAGTSVAAADRRSDFAFVAADEAIRPWLEDAPGGPARVAEWSRAIAVAPRSARLGPELRRIASLADERIASLLGAVPDSPSAWLDELGDAAPSIRLAIAEKLAEEQRYDSCLTWTEGVDANTVFSPALLHYLRAVSWRATVDDEQATQALDELAETPSSEAGPLGPARQWVINALHEELGKKAEPMPGIARRMRDVERRLALSDSGDPTQQRQQGILDDLDKLIEKLEEQRRKQQQQAAAAGGGSSQPGRPAEESRPSELKGPGEIDRKRLVAGDAWGSLPPAERERLTQAITRDYPPHYRALIEDYFRTLADDEQPSDPESEATPR